MTTIFLSLSNIGKVSTFHIETRKTEREERIEAAMAMLEGRERSQL
jgi:hypothetical protein